MSGRDVNIDFGFKGVDIATTAYMSEIDFLTNPVSSHVHSAEMHNQSVNSMALVSARMTASVLELLQMMLSNALCAVCQAVELRWLRSQVLEVLQDLLKKHELPEAGTTPVVQAQGTSIRVNSDDSNSSSILLEGTSWYDIAFTPRETGSKISAALSKTLVSNHHAFIEELETKMDALMSDVRDGKRVLEIASNLGQGTRLVYLFVRQQLGVHFHDGSVAVDTKLSTIYDAIKRRDFTDVIVDAFSFRDLSA